MRKILILSICLAFALLFIFVSPGTIYSQDNNNSTPAVKPKPNDIQPQSNNVFSNEKLADKLMILEKNIEEFKQSIEKLDTKINNTLPLQYKGIKEYGKSVKNHHESIRLYINGIKWFIIVFVLTSTLGLFLFFLKYEKIRSYIIKIFKDDILNTINLEIVPSLKNEDEISRKEEKKLWVRMLTHQGLFFYKQKSKDPEEKLEKCKSSLKNAIHYTERALIKFEELAGNLHPTENELKELLGRIAGNLAYYYVESNTKEKYLDARKYAKISLRIGEELKETEKRDMNFIDNYLFPMKELASDKEEKNKWIKIYDNYRTTLIEENILNENDVKQYDDCYKKWTEEIK